MLDISTLVASRPPCSVAEREAAVEVAGHLEDAGLEPSIERARAITSPTWAPLVRALFRVWGAAFLAAGWPYVTAGLAAISILGASYPVWTLLRYVPLLGSLTTNVVARSPGTDAQARPIVVVAHLDTHPVATDPPSRAQTVASSLFALIAVIASLAGRPAAGGTWRAVAALLAAEAAYTIVWLARRELRRTTEAPDDGTSGLLAITRLAELLDHTSHTADVWIVGSGAGTSGGHGIAAVLRSRAALERAWVIEIDALGRGEVVASPYPSRFPTPGTPQALIRAISEAMRATGDPMTVRHVRRQHSDAKAALRSRVGAITLTAGIHTPVGGVAPDPANAQRTALVVSNLVTGR